MAGDADCPECGEPMRERTNQTTGEIFLGCSDYPRCRGTRSLDAADWRGDADDTLPSERFQARDRQRYRNE